MKHRNHEGTSLNEIKQKIIERVASGKITNDAPDTKRPTAIWRLVKGIQDRLRGSFLYPPIYHVAIRFKKLIPKHRTSYVLADFNRHNDHEFIANAYKVILERYPDEEGINLNLHRLSSGRFTKTEIIGRLRYSKEGRRKGAKIKGLWRRFLLQSLYRVPLFGYLLNLSVSIVMLPKILRNIRKHESFTDMRFDLAANERKGLSEQLDHKAEADYVTKQLALKLDIPVKDHRLDEMYLAFENTFRGSEEDIKERLKVYLPYVAEIEDPAPMLDFGCGRGEWLELMSEIGHGATGVDINRTMIGLCHGKGLDAVESDAIEYLKKQASDSIGVITGFHIIEHLPFEIFIELIDQSLRVLRPGGMLILETPNPENLNVGACNFYMDPTHRNPLHPIATQFFAWNRGFNKVDVLRLHKVREDASTENELIGEIIQKMNMEQDYSIIGWKSL